MKTNHLLFIIFAFLLASPVWAKGDLGPVVLDGKMWKEHYQKFETWQDEDFSWVDKDKKLRFVKPSFTFGTLKVGETLLELSDNKITKIVASIYNKGDNDKLGKEAFLEKIKNAKEALDTLFSTEGKEYKPSLAKTAVKIQGFLWKTEKCTALLEYSISDNSVKNFLGEFVRLSLVSPENESQLIVDSRKTGGATSSGGPANKAKIKTNVVKDENGDVYIKGVPMIDQGQKGYCAAATTARVLGYYGFDSVDQHQIAQLAGTTADKGTSPDVMMKEIRKVLPGRFGLNMKADVVKVDIEDIVKKYNREAKKMKLPPADMTPRNGVINLGDVWQSFNPQALMEARTGNKSQVEKWLKTVKSYTDEGIPIQWSVMVGIFPEQGLPQSSGGHMRIIIGYNQDTQEIIYTDSWGEAHAKKSMPVKQAITITTGMDAILPRS